MSIGKFLHRRSIFVLIGPTNQQLVYIKQQQQLILNPLIIAKKPWLSQAKPKMSNSFELLQGSITDIQKKYEILSDIVAEYNGHIHGSQSHIMQDNSMSLIVYYEVPATAEGNKNREEVERKFENIILASARINY